MPNLRTKDSSMTLRVLVVESDPEELLFLRDVLTELDGGREWSQWTQVEAAYADSWKEAAALLATARYDVIVLDLDLSDTQGKETFRRYKALVPHIPAVLLVQEAAEHRWRKVYCAKERRTSWCGAKWTARRWRKPCATRSTGIGCSRRPRRRRWWIR